MKTNKIPTDTFGRKVHKLTPSGVKYILLHSKTEFGWSFIYDEYTMVGIYRWRGADSGPFNYSVDELEEIDEDLIEILSIDFSEGDIDEAIDLFLYLLDHPCKISRRKMLEKLPVAFIACEYIAIKEVNDEP